MMKMVYSNENSFIVNNVKNILESQGIKTFIKNEFAQGAVGEISAFDSWPEVWITDDCDFDSAMEMVKSIQNKQVTIEWTCKKCAEKNDASFEVCWQCQGEKP